MEADSSMHVEARDAPERRAFYDKIDGKGLVDGRSVGDRSRSPCDPPDRRVALRSIGC
jgi:hypothetical protein